MWTRRGLQRFIVLFFIQLSTRKVQIAGIAADADRLWMSPIGTDLTDAVNRPTNRLLSAQLPQLANIRVFRIKRGQRPRLGPDFGDTVEYATPDVSTRAVLSPLLAASNQS